MTGMVLLLVVTGAMVFCYMRGWYGWTIVLGNLAGILAIVLFWTSELLWPEEG